MQANILAKRFESAFCVSGLQTYARPHFDEQYGAFASFGRRTPVTSLFSGIASHDQALKLPPAFLISALLLAVSGIRATLAAWPATI